MHIDWTALGYVFAVSLVLGAGSVTLFSIGLAAASRGNRLVPTASYLVCAALVCCGIYLVAVH